jgi:hypothetical protein
LIFLIRAPRGQIVNVACYRLAPSRAPRTAITPPALCGSIRRFVLSPMVKLERVGGNGLL